MEMMAFWEFHRGFETLDSCASACACALVGGKEMVARLPRCDALRPITASCDFSRRIGLLWGPPRVVDGPIRSSLFPIILLCLTSENGAPPYSSPYPTHGPGQAHWN
ncbi:hypothetical protein NL676_013236 [Syzygium grande]|nr:hypothetical protein NL676_013236 [Syzygium grande]